MKHLVILISLLFLAFPIPASSIGIPVAETETTFFSNLENGWYRATVKYYNPRTYTRSTYTLNVRVEYDRVTAIDFGNGGSVHSGVNSSGYFYSGGYLSLNYNYSGQVTSASTNVTIINNGLQTIYEVIIE